MSRNGSHSGVDLGGYGPDLSVGKTSVARCARLRGSRLRSGRPGVGCLPSVGQRRGEDQGGKGKAKHSEFPFRLNPASDRACQGRQNTRLSIGVGAGRV